MKNSRDVVVVKYGSSSVTDEHGMDAQRLSAYCDEVEQLRRRYAVAIVSSGAIATGKAMEPGRSLQTPDENFAAVGSAEAFIAWQKELRKKRIASGMVLVTNHEIESEEGGILRRRMLSMMNDRDDGIVPIANGNDVLSKEGAQELRIDTDNDRLAGHIAELLGAKHLVLLTDMPGVLNSDDEVIKHVGVYNVNQTLALARERQIREGGGGRGGMHSKVKVAYEASHAGLEPGFAHIAEATNDLQAVIACRVGTHFAPHA